jgi:hypothetical protein
MKLLNRLLAPFLPPAIEDSDFGTLHFVHVPRNPAKSYWECEWLFQPTNTRIPIALAGGDEGPTTAARNFYLQLRDEFPRILNVARPKINRAILDWLNRPLNTNLWEDVRLHGFSADDLEANPIEWHISFETTGSKWISIKVPFRGDVPQEPVIET